MRLPLPVLETERLVLRPFRPGDESGIYHYCSQEATTRFMVWPRHRTLQDSEHALAYFLQAYASGEDLPLALVRRMDDKVIGSVGFQWPLKPKPWAAWILGADAWGQGYASEAVRAALAWAWTAFPQWQAVEAPIHGANEASLRFAKRLGFTQIACELAFQMTNLDGKEHRATNWELLRPEV